MKNIRICGVGSVLVGDDAAGPYAVRWLEANYQFAKGDETGASVAVEDLGTPGLDLVAHMTGMDVLIMIDSVDNHLPPGSVTVYDKAELTRHMPAVRLDPHSPCITECILIAEMAGECPSDVCLIGITPESLEPGPPLSESVKNAIPLAVEKALQRALLHGACFSKRAVAVEADIWWEAAPWGACAG